MAHLRLFLLLLWPFAERSMAGGVAVRFGPSAIGSGGTNPVSIPPEAYDLGLAYVTDKGIECNIAVTGLSIAVREKFKWGGYSSVGGGFARSANGAGIGPYAAFGFESGCGGWLGCFSAEFSQALGIGSQYLASPTALRMGLMKWL